MQLLAWLAVCGLVALITRRRPELVVVAVIVLWFAVPAVSGYRLTGIRSGTLAVHPASWLVLVAVIVQIQAAPSRFAATVARHVGVFLAVGTFVVGAVLISRLTDSGGTRLLIDQIVVPFLSFWMILSRFAVYGTYLKVRNALLVVVAFESVLAIIQSVVGSILFYESDYLTFYWFKPDKFDRWMGTTDSPLVLSLAICVAAALTLGIRRSLLRLPLLVAYLMGALVTQSRTGVALMAVIIVYTLIRARMSTWPRLGSLVVVAVSAVLLARSSFATGFTGRLANDTGSTTARLRALGFVYENWESFLFVGGGLTSSYRAARMAGLQTSIESSYLMFAVDVGLVLATMYFGTQYWLIIRHGSMATVPGAPLAALVGCTLQHTFSGIATTSAVGTVTWLALALVVGAAMQSQRRSALMWQTLALGGSRRG